MFTFLKSLFGKIDRQETAFERAAVAAEGIADDLEKLRDAFRERLDRSAVLADRTDDTARIGRRRSVSV